MFLKLEEINQIKSCLNLLFDFLPVATRKRTLKVLATENFSYNYCGCKIWTM
jgi:hypothetical protein